MSENPTTPRYCHQPPSPERRFAPEVTPDRARLIRRLDKKWVNGTVLRYHFFRAPASWTTTEEEREVVRQAFQMWKDVGIGIELREVASPTQAEIRIRFLRGDGAWSLVGRDMLLYGTSQPTMNFGWDLTEPGQIDTAIHEIGHSLGFPHEHQNPISGIVWDEPAVYAALGAPPNRWDRETTYYNIIRKIEADAVQGSAWDPDSIMHYPFGPGLILEPPEYRNGVDPAPGLSARDRDWAQRFYPPMDADDRESLQALQSVRLEIGPGEQSNFLIVPEETRGYTLATFGQSDTVLVLFEDVGGTLRYLSADDDSGVEENARLQVRLVEGRRYVLRVRLYYRQGDVGLMMW